jgi:hypothetical protein
MIQEQKKKESREGVKEKLRKLFKGNPYNAKSLDIPEQTDEPPDTNGPIYSSDNDDSNAPSPRQSEYITHPSLS